MRRIERVLERYRNGVRDARMRALVRTQHELAMRTGIPRSTISALECDRLFLSSAYALLIAEALDCEVGDLFVKRHVPRRRRIRVAETAR